MAARPDATRTPMAQSRNSSFGQGPFHPMHISSAADQNGPDASGRSDTEAYAFVRRRGGATEPTTQMGSFHRPHQKMIGSR